MDESLLNKKNKDYIVGKEYEKELIEIFRKYDYICIPSEKNEDINEHWDFKTRKDVNGLLVEKKIDVKGFKHSHSEGYTWIEIKNVKGDDGWIYGDSDYIAFTLEDSFILVDRIKLSEFIDGKLEELKKSQEYGLYFDKNTLPIYRKYQRTGRRDILMKIPIDDLKEFTIKKINREI